jgi:ankyrin repeat protein
MCEIYGADWEQADANGVTPLMKAAGLNRSFYLDKLIALGVKIDTKDPRGRTAADFARINENHELADKLD